MSSADEIARLAALIPQVELLVGSYLSTNVDGSVQIDFGAGGVTCVSSALSQPLAGDSVRCLRVNASTCMLGPAAPRYGYGTVTATGSPMTVTTSYGSLPLYAAVSYTTPTIGDTVLIDWAANGMVLTKVAVVPGSTFTPSAPPATSGSADFRPIDSGSYQSGSWWTPQVWCSSTNVGAWFYGTTIGDTIPDGATITGIQLYVPEFYNEFPSSLATIGLHTLTTKSGAPSVTDTVTISAGAGWKPMPAAFGDSLKTGAKRGLGTNHGGFHKFRSLAEDASSGLLSINWSV